MGYITNTRILTKARPYGRTWEPVYGPPWRTQEVGPPGGLFLEGSLIPTQTTTSYRTGKWVDGKLDEDDANILTSSNQADFFSALKDEYGHAPQSSYDTGHEFETVTQQVICTPKVDINWSTFGFDYRYEGHLFCPPYYSSNYWIAAPDINPNQYGPKAINACIPTNPVVNLMVTLAELHREGFPKLGKALYDSLKEGKRIQSLFGTASEEYLAWQFGVKPLLADYQASLVAGSTYATKLESFAEGSGELLHRQYTFPVDRFTEQMAVGGAGYAVPISPSSTPQTDGLQGSGSGSRKEYLTYSREVWFSGAFTYVVPSGNSALDRAKRIEQEANNLLGTRFDAEVLWNLAPWSWLSDWHNNIGINISNADALIQDGLVMQYGYLMFTTQSDHTVVISGVRDHNGVSLGPITTIFREVRKKRVKASPFGFGLNPTSFTDRQWSILAALGFTHGPRQLR